MKRLILLIALISASAYSFSRPLYDGLKEGDNNSKFGNDVLFDVNCRCNDLQNIRNIESLKDNLQSGRNPKKQKRGTNSKRKSKEKTSKKNSKRNTAKNSPKRIVPRTPPKRTSPKRIHNSDLGIGLLAEAIGGYSNFMWSDGSPVAGLGFGGGVIGQLHLNEIGHSPDGYFAELGINYIRKGSGAYPIDYVNAKVLPLGYSFNQLFGDFSLFFKAGGYVAYPFSDLKTNKQSFNTNLDYGAIGCVGVSYDRFAVSVSYEHGFADVSNANVNLKNQNIFLTISYRIL